MRHDYDILVKRNKDLEKQNQELIVERDALRKYKADLDKAQKEIN